MAPVRADVSQATDIHFHGFGVARQGPWFTVEKVGIELIATPNRARNAPKAVCLVPFGARSWVKAATKDVFQQPDVFYEVRLETDRKVLDVLVA